MSSSYPSRLRSKTVAHQEAEPHVGALKWEVLRVRAVSYWLSPVLEVVASARANCVRRGAPL